MKHLFWRIQAAVFYLLTLAASRIPQSIANRVGSLAGLLIPYLVPKRRGVIHDNITMSLPFMQAHHLWDSNSGNAECLARETFKNLGRSLMEICHLYHGRSVDLIDSIEIRGWNNYETARAKGRGVLIFSGHCGNWELMFLTICSLLGNDVSGVARRQNNPFLNTMVEKMRSRFNGKMIYKLGALKAILLALKRQGVVGILADQAAFPEDGNLINILGRKAWATRAPVIIARKTRAPLLPVFIHFEDGQHVLTIYPEHVFTGSMTEEGMQKDTQALSRYVENYIVAHPTQWYWVHKRWKRAGAAA